MKRCDLEKIDFKNLLPAQRPGYNRCRELSLTPGEYIDPTGKKVSLDYQHTDNQRINSNDIYVVLSYANGITLAKSLSAVSPDFKCLFVEFLSKNLVKV